jgi:hypothetical protein
MSRNALIASLAGAITLGVSALSAQAASVPVSDAGISSGLVQRAHYRHYRHHRYYDYYYYRRHHHHHHYYRHHHRRYW